MQFTDITFGILLIIVFCLYWFPLRGNTHRQNVLLLAASYLFYGWWDWRFLGLIILTSLTTFLSALYAKGRFGKTLTAANIILNVAILLCFKYLGFFTENIRHLFELFGIGLDWFTVEVMVPVGLSFYTFQAIGYSIDVYKGRIGATKDALAFFTFISYFPQLVAGPIERASQLLPQITSRRRWDTATATSGMRLIMFGLLKKLCVADMLAYYVDRIFTGEIISPVMTLAGGILFSIEIYCDFSAYSEIARGVSRLLGIELMVNFKFPYFSRNIPSFWRRWHISLMQWFRDYLYIPLGGNRKGERRTMLNIMLIFLLSGLWHGAGWNFVLWGVYWGIFSVVARFVLHQRVADRPLSIKDVPQMTATFGVAALGFFFFRCSHSAELLSGLKGSWLYIAVFALLWAVAKMCVRYRIVMATVAITVGAAVLYALIKIISIDWALLAKAWWLVPAALVFGIEWKAKNTDYPMQHVSKKQWQRMLLYAVSIFCIAISEPTGMKFIYFQF